MAINVKDKLVTVEGVKAAFDIEAEARDNADQALSDRIDNIVAPEGDPSLSEVSDARTNKNGTVYNTLKARLDADASATETEISKINGSLGQLSKDANNLWYTGEIKEGYRINATHGRYEEYEGWNATDFIPVDQGDMIYGVGARYFFYDENQLRIPGATGILNYQPEVSEGSGVHYIITPTNAKYFRISQNMESITEYYLFKRKFYETYLKGLVDGVDSKIAELATRKDLAFVGLGKLTDVPLTIGYNINSSGEQVESQYAALSDFVENSLYYQNTGINRDTNDKVLSTYIHEFDSEKVWLRRTNITPDGARTMHTGDDCAYVKIVFSRLMADKIEVTQADLNAYFEVSTYRKIVDLVEDISRIENSTEEAAITEYRRRASDRMKLLTDIKWTPLAEMPKQYRDADHNIKYGRFDPGVEQTGIPYGNQLVYERWPGKAVLFETVISAIKNVHSVMYSTERFNPSTYYRPGPWYSIVCSKAVSFALGIKQNYANGNFAIADGMAVIALAGNYTADDICIADVLESPGVHTAMVTDVVYDVFGKVRQIEVGEAVTPCCRRRRWNIEGAVDNFFTVFDGYNLYRYTRLYEIAPVYDALDVYVSATLILSNGNSSNYYVGDTVKVTLMSKPNNTVEVYKNGELLSSIDVSNNSAGDEITVPVSGAGEYYLTFTDGETKDYARFMVNDCAATYDSTTGLITFSSTTGKLSQIAYCTGNYRSNITNRDQFPTIEELANGTIVASVPSNANYIHCFFSNLFGLVLVEIAL